MVMVMGGRRREVEAVEMAQVGRGEGQTVDLVRAGGAP